MYEWGKELLLKDKIDKNRMKYINIYVQRSSKHILENIKQIVVAKKDTHLMINRHSFTFIYKDLKQAYIKKQ